MNIYTFLKFTYQAAAHWKPIGEQLKLSKEKLDTIQTIHSASNSEALEQVLIAWKKNGNPAFVWKTILDLLASEEIGEKELANSIRPKLKCEITGCNIVRNFFISIWKANFAI